MVTFFGGLSVFQRLAPRGGWTPASSGLQLNDLYWLWLVLCVGTVWNQANDNDEELAVKCLQVVWEQNIDLCWSSSLLTLCSCLSLCGVSEGNEHSLFVELLCPRLSQRVPSKVFSHLCQVWTQIGLLLRLDSELVKVRHVPHFKRRGYTHFFCKLLC